MSAAENTDAIATRGPRVYSREAVLLGCFVILFGLLLFTAFVSRMYHKQIHVLADDWFAQGEASFKNGDIKTALTDYRNALVYSPGNTRFQFHLALALAAAGRDDEARSYLLNLLSESPGSGEINLALARIAARNGPMAEALRYYHSAIYGEFETDPIAMRWRIRREFCEYLLNHGAANQAVPEIIALANNTPADDAEKLRIAAELLNRAKLWTRALDMYRSDLAKDKRDEGALLGAATSAFELGQYSLAADYIEQLPPQDRADPGIAAMLETAQQVQALDPFLPGITLDAKIRRVSSALSLAKARVQDCAQEDGQSLTETPPRTALQKSFAWSSEARRDWSSSNLLRHPESLDEGMSLVFEMENAAADACGEPQGEDRALWLLGRSRGAKVQ
jgi:thioredoxin-like negative regulator of GroEL